jgi:hypothetical protein
LNAEYTWLEMNMTQDQPAWRDDGEPSKSIAEFCLLERISKATFHALARKGLGPMTMREGSLVRIIESRRSWHERMLWHCQLRSEQREQQRRREQASRAGQAAARSPLHVSQRVRNHSAATRSRRNAAT